jgi:hypothetical protein
MEYLMRNRALFRICALATSCFVVRLAAQDAGQDDELEAFKRSLATTIASNATSTAVYDSNGFHVVSAENAELDADLRPDGERFQVISLTAPGVFGVLVEKGRPMSTGGGVSISHRASGQPILSVGDTNGDGALDVLTYSKVDKDGRSLLDVVDYEVDGQPDLRIHFAERYSEVWHVDRWYRVENREGRRGIVLNGVFVELKRENNRFVVP